MPDLRKQAQGNPLAWGLGGALLGGLGGGAAGYYLGDERTPEERWDTAKTLGWGGAVTGGLLGAHLGLGRAPDPHKARVTPPARGQQDLYRAFDPKRHGHHFEKAWITVADKELSDPTLRAQALYFMKNVGRPGADTDQLRHIQDLFSKMGDSVLIGALFRSLYNKHHHAAPVPKNMQLQVIKKAAFMSTVHSYALFHGVKLALNDVGAYRFNSTAESNDKQDNLERLWAAFDRKPSETGNESSHGTIFMEGTTG